MTGIWFSGNKRNEKTAFNNLNEVNAEHLVGYHRRCLEILTEIVVPWEARWMKIDQNAVVDTLATEAFVEATGRKPKVWGKRR
jgi:hypothetical protein